MSSLIVLIYGLIQGLAEFLPISSSGHLAILPSLINFKDPGVIFDLLLHVGTAIAIIVYFHKEVKSIFLQILNIFKTKSLDGSWFVVNFFIATVMSVAFILVFKDLAQTIGRSTDLIAINLIFFGLFMWISDLKKTDESKEMSSRGSMKSAIIIGISQSLAIFPGVSRSGITLTAARSMSISREEASRFSFLLSLPIIIASTIYKLPEILNGSATYVEPINIILAIAISFIVGLLTIHYFLKFIKRIGLLPFAIYRVILGLVLLIWY